MIVNFNWICGFMIGFDTITKETGTYLYIAFGIFDMIIQWPNFDESETPPRT